MWKHVKKCSLFHYWFLFPSAELALAVCLSRLEGVQTLV